MRARRFARLALGFLLVAGCSSSSTSEPDAGGADGGRTDGGAPDAGVTCMADACRPKGWASWPMPNPESTGLPHPARYTIRADVAAEESTGLEWQRTASAAKVTYAAAMAMCEALVLEGKDDWRLPTRIELVSLVDFTRRPALDVGAFPDTPEDYFWAQTLTAWDKNLAWSAYFGLGLSAYGAVDGESAHVRCVRGGRVVSTERYALTAATVRDLNTGLTWMRRPFAEPLTLEAGADVCRTATIEGLKEWRLPSQKEIQTTVDETRHEPAVDPAVFPDTPVGRFWTSSPVNKPNVTESVYWDSKDGAIEEASSTSAYYIRCVR